MYSCVVPSANSSIYVFPLSLKLISVFSSILKTNKFEDEISKISKEDFDKSPLTLSLSNSFYEKRIYYNYDEYLEHLELTNEYVKNNKNYILTNNPNHTFRNIQISICKN